LIGKLSNYTLPLNRIEFARPSTLSNVHADHQRSKFSLTVCQRLAIDDCVTLGHGDAVQQRLFAQICVDQGHNDAQLGQAQPDAHEFGSVFHEECDHVAVFVAMGVECVGEAI
jgi:hypothetical protein